MRCVGTRSTAVLGETAPYAFRYYLSGMKVRLKDLRLTIDCPLVQDDIKWNLLTIDFSMLKVGSSLKIDKEK